MFLGLIRVLDFINYTYIKYITEPFLFLSVIEFIQSDITLRYLFI